MRVASICLSFDAASGGFATEELEELQAQPRREIIEVRDHFFVHDGLPHWALLVLYRDDPEPGEPVPERRRRDWTTDLDEVERAVFERVRQWRNARAEADGVPAFTILTNRQVAELARKRPQGRAELRAVRGVGNARMKKYGEELLDLLQGGPRPAKADGDTSGTAGDGPDPATSEPEG